MSVIEAKCSAQSPAVTVPERGLAKVLIPANAGIKRFLWHIGAIVLSAVLIHAAAPGIGHWPWLVPLAFFPWFAVLRGLCWKAAGLSGLLMGMAYIAPGRWDTFAAPLANVAPASVQQIGLLLLFFASFAFPFALFAMIDARMQGAARAACWTALPRAAVLATLVCALWSPFPYTPVAMVVDWTELLQLAGLGGEALVLTLLLWPSAALATAWQRRRAGMRSLRTLVPVVLVGLSAFAYGHHRLDSMDSARADGQGRQLAAMPLQLDLPIQASPALLSRDRPKARSSALELTRAGLDAAPSCEVVVWPEAPLGIDQTARACADVSAAAATLGAPLLMQCTRPAQELWQITAEWLRPGAAVESHAKSSLVPHYEKPLLKRGELLAGPPGGVFALDESRRIIPALCYELHSRSHLRASVLQGGNVIAHMASFAAFERHPIDTWDGAMARIRAVEFGVPIIRAINRGPIGWIDAAGREHRVGERFGRQAPCLDIWLPAASPTVFAWIAPLAPWIPGLLALGWVVAGRRSLRGASLHAATPVAAGRHAH